MNAATYHREKFGKNVLVTIAALVIFLVTRMIIPPIVLHYVSLTDYGLWTYAFLVVGYLSMSVFGISNVYVRYSALYFAKDEQDKIGKLASTGMAGVFISALILLPLLWILLPWILHLLNVPQDHYNTAYWLIFGMGIVFFFELMMGAFPAILQGIQEIALERMITTASYLLETVLIVLFLWMGYGIFSLMWAYILRTAVCIIGLAYVCFHKLKNFTIGWNQIDRSLVPLFYKFGGIVQLTGMLAVLNRSLEKLIAGLTLGARATALYELGEKFPLSIMNIPGAVNSVLLPTTAYLHAAEHHDELKNLYIKGGRYLHLMAGIMLAFIWGWAEPLMVFWLGDVSAYKDAVLILVFFSVAYQMDVLTGPASALYRSINKPERELVYPVAQLVLCLLGYYWAQSVWGPGIKAINWGVAGGMVISALAYIAWSNVHFTIPQTDYLKKVFIPGIIPYAIAFILSSLLEHDVTKGRWEGFKQLALGGAAYATVVIPFLYLTLDPQERAYLWIYGRNKTTGTGSSNIDNGDGLN